MNKTARGVIASLALLLLVAGTAFAVANPVALEHRSPVAASHEPKASASEDADEPGDAGEGQDAAPSADAIARLVQRLSDAGLDTDAASLTELIDAYGVGGAVRLLAWADTSGTSLEDLRGLRDSGMGWGQIARQLNDADASLNLSPGIGGVMSGDHGSGQAADEASANADAVTDGKANGRDTAPGQNRP